MLSKTFEVDGVKATVHTDNGRSYLAKKIIYRKVDIDPSDAQAVEEWVMFTRAVTQSADVVVPFPWPTAASSREELVAAKDCFLALSWQVISEWDAALTEVDTPPITEPDVSSTTPKND